MFIGHLEIFFGEVAVQSSAHFFFIGSSIFFSLICRIFSLSVSFSISLSVSLYGVLEQKLLKWNINIP